MRTKCKSSYHNRRYYLHRIVKQKFQIDTISRQVDIRPYDSFNEIPVPERYYVGQLIKLGYNIQLKLF